MFESLPEVQQDSLDAFVDSRDFEWITKDINPYMQQLREKNPCLAKAVEGAAATAVELNYLTFTPHLKEALLGNCVVAMLLVLQLVDRELECIKLKKLLTGKID